MKKIEQELFYVTDPKDESIFGKERQLKPIPSPVYAIPAADLVDWLVDGEMIIHSALTDPLNDRIRQIENDAIPKHAGERDWRGKSLGWAISHRGTGAGICVERTKKGAIVKAKYILDRMGRQNFNANIETFINGRIVEGIAPGYND